MRWKFWLSIWLVSGFVTLLIRPILVLVRRLFWRRVTCAGNDCQNPAVWKCVYYGDNPAATLGADYARDPLCGRHGKAGRCPADRHAIHEAIPESQRWVRRRLRLRSPFWFEEG
jgi:hypothetical protein